MKALTTGLFQQAAKCTAANAAKYLPHLQQSMDRFGIGGLAPVSALIANIVVETMHLTQMEESLYYRDAERIVKLYLRKFDEDRDRVADPEEIERAKPYVKNHAGLSQLLYGGYHGRGGLQLTWQTNYAKATMALERDYVNNPDFVKRDEDAMLTACWYFADNGCIKVADRIDSVVRLINPAMMHLAERRAAYAHATSVLA